MPKVKKNMPQIAKEYNGTNNTQKNASDFSDNKFSSFPEQGRLLEQSIALNCFVFILSLTTIIANALVIKTVFTTPRLKRINAMFLAAHIALCDFIIGASLLAIATKALIPEQAKGLSQIWSRYTCPITTTTRSIALLLEPSFLFLLTLDRYKLIVNFSKPHTHLTKSFIFISTCIAWSASVTLVGGEAFGSAKDNKYEGNLCNRVHSSKNYFIYIEKTVIVVNAILFVLCCVMYFRIYKIVRNQNVNMGTQTYTRVSKLIFALLLSTLVLWYVPAMVVASIGNRKSTKGTQTLTILISFTTNSLVNPFLYVFRDKNFRKNCFPCITHLRQQNQHCPSEVNKTGSIQPGKDLQLVSHRQTNEVYDTSL
ncbi:uncharacterized protein LOC141866425 [Acropora palmata]